MSTTVYPFDSRPLTEPVDRAAARAFASELRASGRAPSLFSVSGIFMMVFAAIFLLVFGSVAVTMIGAAVRVIAGGGSGGFLVGFIPIAIIGVVIVIIVTVVIQKFRGAGVRWYRLDRFARANGMSFEPRYDNPPLPGMIFSVGSSRAATDLVRGQHPRFVEFANYTYTTGSGKNKTTHDWGYVAVRLDVPLPNIVLDATSNNGLFGASNLPSTFHRNQRLSLEGDFDKYFSLYCPEGYERDALYLFTPDIMARFIDNAAAVDVEIVDDWLFLYAKRPFSTLDPATWAWLFSVVGALLDKFAQWARWRDERLRMDAAAARATLAPAAAGTAVAGGGAEGEASAPFVTPPAALRPPPGVAPEGRRLKKGVPWAAFIVVGVFLVAWFLMQSGVLTRLLG